MYFCERHQKIIEILEEKGSATVGFLAKELFVSLPTIRRDLSFLESQNRLRRTFGGAVLSNMLTDEIPFEVRDREDAECKKILAEKAKKFIKEEMVIFLDASSTVFRLIPYLKEFKNLTIITNSPKVNLALADLGIKSIPTGGILLEKSKAYVGNSAENFIKNFNADLFFFSCRGISDNGILTDSSIDESNIRRVMLSHSEKSIFMCSSKKIGKKYMYNLASIKDIDEFVCDIDTTDLFK